MAPSNHPHPRILKAFGAGTLDAADTVAVRAHLKTCPDCTRLVAGVNAEPIPPELLTNADYTNIEELSRGGMGVIYKATSVMTGRLEVLKVMNRDQMRTPGASERFRREIQSAALLDHPNIVRVLFARPYGDLLVLAMEYVPGEDLKTVVEARGPLPVVNACYYVQQAAKGLQHAYEKGMVHRDIKPSNLIRTASGKQHTVKILDFGLAKLTSESANESALTKTGQVLGTPDYIAPEQIRKAQAADIRADIYALGSTLYFLLTGRPPFQVDNLYDLFRHHHEVDPVPVHVVRPQLPPALSKVVGRMMAKDPAARYQTPNDVVAALEPFVKGGTTPHSKRERNWGKVLLAMSIGGISLGVSILVLILTFKSSPKAEIASEPQQIAASNAARKSRELESSRAEPKGASELKSSTEPKGKPDPKTTPIAKTNPKTEPKGKTDPFPITAPLPDKPKEPPTPVVREPVELTPRWTAAADSQGAPVNLFIDEESKTILLGSERTGLMAFDLVPGTNRQRAFPWFGLTGGDSFLPLDRGRVAKCAMDAIEIQTWDIKSGKTMEKYPIPEIPPGTGTATHKYVRLSPNLQYLVVARTAVSGGDRPEVPLRVFDTKSGKPVLSTDWTGGSTHFTADSKRLLLAEANGRFRWFKLPGGEVDGEWDYGPPGPSHIHLVSGISADGRVIGYMGPGKLNAGLGPRLVDGNNGDVLYRFDESYASTSTVAVSSDGRFAAAFHRRTKTETEIDVVTVPKGVPVARAIVPVSRAAFTYTLSARGDCLLVHDPKDGKLCSFDVPIK